MKKARVMRAFFLRRLQLLRVKGVFRSRFGSNL